MFGYQDGINRLTVTPVDPPDRGKVLVMAQHGSSSTVVTLDRRLVTNLRDALTTFLDESSAEGVVSEVLCDHGLGNPTVDHLTNEIVDALQRAGYLP